MWEKFLQWTEEILSVGEHFYSEQKRSSVWGNISTVNRRDPQCGGTFLQWPEEILSVGENYYSVQKRSSVWGNIVYNVKKNPRRGGYLYRASVKKNPQRGGYLYRVWRRILGVGDIYIECKEESSVWGNSLSCIYNKRSSVLRNIVKF